MLSSQGLEISVLIIIHTDSRALLGSWQSRGGSTTEINDVIKAILQCSQEFNFSIDM